MSQGKLLLFFDTETTGLPLWGEPSEDPRQPHIVQLSALLVEEDTRKVVEELDVLVKPEGWTIPDEVVAIHGITTEHALEHGISEAEALRRFLALHELCDERVAHVENFDQRIIRIALKRYRSDEAADAWKAAPAQCTGKMTALIMQMPLAKKTPWAKWKTPKLAEAYLEFIGKPMAGAHSAGADTRACMEIFFAVHDRLAAAAKPIAV